MTQAAQFQTVRAAVCSICKLFLSRHRWKVWSWFWKWITIQPARRQQRWYTDGFQNYYMQAPGVSSLDGVLRLDKTRYAGNR